MDDRIHVLVDHGLSHNRQGFIRGHIHLNEGGVSDAIRTAGEHIVDHHDLVAALLQKTNNVCADVTGASSNKNAHEP